MTTGVVYIYRPAKYWDELLEYSMASINLPIEIIECKSQIECLETRLNLPTISKFDRTIYLDIDTVLFSPFEPGEVPNLFSMQNWYNSEDIFNWPKEWLGLPSWKAVDAKIPWYNTGMIVLSKDDADFFKEWEKEWRRYSENPIRPLEPALINAIYKTGYQINKLDFRWNIPAWSLMRENSVPANWFRLVHSGRTPISEKLKLLKIAKELYDRENNEKMD